MEEKFNALKKPVLETKIWRYMDFTKLVSVLSKSALYFTREDLLDDAFEGSIPKAFRPQITSEIKTLCREFNPKDYKKELKEIRNAHKSIHQVHSAMIRAERKLTFINSWHMNEIESVAMWRLYLKSAEGVAFQSTFKKLSESFIEKEKVNFGMINYVDDFSDDFNVKDEFLYHLEFPFMFKRKCFEYEKELRAFILTEPVTEKAKKQYLKKQGIRGMPEGLDEQVDLKMLVERIYVSPTAGKWFVELVKSVVKKYGFDIDVVLSPLADSPTF